MSYKKHKPFSVDYSGLVTESKLKKFDQSPSLYYGDFKLFLSDFFDSFVEYRSLGDYSKVIRHQRYLPEYLVISYAHSEDLIDNLTSI